MSNPPPLVAALGRDLGGTGRGAGVGRVVVTVPPGECPTLGEWREGSGCSGGMSGWALALALGALNPFRGPGQGAWRGLLVLENHPPCTLICRWFFAWRRTLSAMAPEEAINPLSSALERCCGFSRALRKPHCGRYAVRYTSSLWGTLGFGAAQGG